MGALKLGFENRLSDSPSQTISRILRSNSQAKGGYAKVGDMDMYPVYDDILIKIHNKIVESKDFLRNIHRRLDVTNSNLVEIYNKVDNRSNALLTEAKTISAQVGKDAPDRKLITGRMAHILNKLNALKETLLTLNSAVVKINENLVTTNGNMLHNYSELAPGFFQHFQTVKNHQSKMLQESEKSRRELFKAIDEFHRDIVEELQKSRAELIGGLRSHPKRGENESDASATPETNQAQGVQEDWDFRNDVRDLQSLLAFQQHTTNLALNIIVDLLLPISGQEHPYPPSLQQKLIQLAERMREAKPS